MSAFTAKRPGYESNSFDGTDWGGLYNAINTNRITARGIEPIAGGLQRPDNQRDTVYTGPAPAHQPRS
jgi:hypothetical protein